MVEPGYQRVAEAYAAQQQQLQQAQQQVQGYQQTAQQLRQATPLSQARLQEAQRGSLAAIQAQQAQVDTAAGQLQAVMKEQAEAEYLEQRSQQNVSTMPTGPTQAQIQRAQALSNLTGRPSQLAAYEQLKKQEAEQEKIIADAKATLAREVGYVDEYGNPVSYVPGREPGSRPQISIVSPKIPGVDWTAGTTFKGTPTTKVDLPKQIIVPDYSSQVPSTSTSNIPKMGDLSKEAYVLKVSDTPLPRPVAVMGAPKSFAAEGQMRLEAAYGGTNYLGGAKDFVGSVVEGAKNILSPQNKEKELAALKELEAFKIGASLKAEILRKEDIDLQLSRYQSEVDKIKNNMPKFTSQAEANSWAQERNAELQNIANRYSKILQQNEEQRMRQMNADLQKQAKEIYVDKGLIPIEKVYRKSLFEKALDEADILVGEKFLRKVLPSPAEVLQKKFISQGYTKEQAAQMAAREAGKTSTMRYEEAAVQLSRSQGLNKYLGGPLLEYKKLLLKQEVMSPDIGVGIWNAVTMRPVTIGLTIGTAAVGGEVFGAGVGTAKLLGTKALMAGGLTKAGAVVAEKAIGTGAKIFFTTSLAAYTGATAMNILSTPYDQRGRKIGEIAVTQLAPALAGYGGYQYGTKIMQPRIIPQLQGGQIKRINPITGEVERGPARLVATAREVTPMGREIHRIFPTQKPGVVVGEVEQAYSVGKGKTIISTELGQKLESWIGRDPFKTIKISKPYSIRVTGMSLLEEQKTPEGKVSWVTVGKPVYTQAKLLSTGRFGTETKLTAVAGQVVEEKLPMTATEIAQQPKFQQKLIKALNLEPNKISISADDFRPQMKPLSEYPGKYDRHIAGRYVEGTRTIYIKDELFKPGNEAKLQQIYDHELGHYWADVLKVEAGLTNSQYNKFMKEATIHMLRKIEYDLSQSYPEKLAALRVELKNRYGTTNIEKLPYKVQLELATKINAAVGAYRPEEFIGEYLADTFKAPETVSFLKTQVYPAGTKLETSSTVEKTIGSVINRKSGDIGLKWPIEGTAAAEIRPSASKAISFLISQDEYKAVFRGTKAGTSISLEGGRTPVGQKYPTFTQTVSEIYKNPLPAPKEVIEAMVFKARGGKVIDFGRIGVSSGWTPKADVLKLSAEKALAAEKAPVILAKAAMGESAFEPWAKTGSFDQFMKPIERIGPTVPQITSYPATSPAARVKIAAPSTPRFSPFELDEALALGSSVLISANIPSTNQILSPGLVQIPESALKQIPTLALTPAVSQVPVTPSSVVQSSALAQVPVLVVSPATAQAQAQVQVTTLSQTPSSASALGIPEVPLKGFGLPDLPLRRVKTMKKKKATKGILAYVPELRRRGKYIALAEPMSKGRALKLGAEAALKSLGATFRARPVQTFETTRGRDIDFYPNPKVFRAPASKQAKKEMPLTFVQRKTLRIKSPGEIREALVIRRRKNVFRKIGF